MGLRQRGDFVLKMLWIFSPLFLDPPGTPPDYPQPGWVDVGWNPPPSVFKIKPRPDFSLFFSEVSLSSFPPMQKLFFLHEVAKVHFRLESHCLLKQTVTCGITSTGILLPKAVAVAEK